VPELPEVELYARFFARHGLHRTIQRVEVRDERILGVTRKDEFVRRLRGKQFTRVRRHGKHFFAYTDGQAGAPVLHLHFGMSGDLAFNEEPRHTRVLFAFGDGTKLAFEDMRLFGVADLVDDPDAFIAEHRLGRDPLDPHFTLRDFRELMSKRRGAVKAMLMSQEVVAGLGNLWVDETLFATGIAPRRPVEKLRDSEVKGLFTAMRKIVNEVIARKERGLEPPPRYLLWHRQEGERCPKCGGTIRRSVVAGRTTYACGKHQR
jgi:formamidopyrimidine-DNA glycosylase